MTGDKKAYRPVSFRIHEEGIEVSISYRKEEFGENCIMRINGGRAKLYFDALWKLGNEDLDKYFKKLRCESYR